jgi:hypothetical protein
MSREKHRPPSKHKYRLAMQLSSALIARPNSAVVAVRGMPSRSPIPAYRSRICAAELRRLFRGHRLNRLFGGKIGNEIRIKGDKNVQDHFHTGRDRSIDCGIRPDDDAARRRRRRMRT